MTSRRVIVIGAGAAGLLAAGRAAACGAETILLEKMDRPGRKLLITGNRRCNLTHRAPLPAFIEHFGPQGTFLRQAFSRFFTNDLLAFLEGIGLPTVTEPGGRVFPASEAARDVVGALVGWVRDSGATLRTRSRAVGLLVTEQRVTGVRIASLAGPGREKAAELLSSDAVILATGGASYPQTGSSGDGYRLAQQVGHTLAAIRPALVPLVAAGEIGRRLQGVSLRGVTARLLIDERLVARESGEMIFTHFGISGPLVLTLSGRAVDALQAGAAVVMAIDLHPTLDERALDEHLRRELKVHGRRKTATLLAGLLPRKLVAICAALNELDLEKPGHQVTAAERRRLRDWLKNFRIEISGHRPLSEAIITAGGVDVREIDPRTMASQKAGGLHLCGELLDLAADTGGFNLQAAFSTGWLAGGAAAGEAGEPRRRSEES